LQQQHQLGTATISTFAVLVFWLFLHWK